MISEPTKIVTRITDGIVDLFSKNKQHEKKIKTFLSLIAIIFVIIPIVFHFLALQELQIHANIIAELSSTDASNLSPELFNQYKLLVDKYNDRHLLISDITSSVTTYIERLTDNAISLYQTEISGRFQYVGYGFKPDLFKPILLWNLIPLIILSMFALIMLTVDYNKENSGLKKVLYPILWGTGMLIVVGIYSLILAYVLALLCPIVFFSPKITIGAIVFFSLVLTGSILWKLIIQL